MLDQFELAFEPMLMFFFGGEHLLQHLTAAVVGDLCRKRYQSVETPDGNVFDVEVKL